MVNMTEDEFTRCIQSYEDRGYWAAAGHWFAAGVVITALVALPLAYIGASMGLYLGVQQEVKK